MLLSVIIPTANRPSLAGGLLDSLAGQAKVDFPWEVLVVENGPQDRTSGVVREKAASLPVRSRYIPEPEPGLHRARHRGAREARGCFLAFLDDDMVLSDHWLHGVSYLASGQAQAVAGRVLPRWAEPPPAWLARLASSGVYGYLSLLDLGSEAKPVPPTLAFGCNLFLPKRLLLDLCGFHPDGMPLSRIEFRGDGECGLMRKLERAGHQAWYDPTATAYHLVGKERMTLAYLRRRAFCEGISASFTRTRATRGRTASCAPPREESDGRAFRRQARKLASLTRCAALSLAYDGPITTYVRLRLRIAEKMGFWFHQRSLAARPDLQRWVDRKHYLD